MARSQNIERERKFLVESLPRNLSRYPHQSIEQGYLVIPTDRQMPEVRIRRSANRSVLTFKLGRSDARLEVEIPLSPASARRLWPLTRGKRLEKTRYKIPYKGLTIEVDVFRGNARGLTVAEVEFASARALRAFRPPDWMSKEISGRRRYSNVRIAVHGWKRR
jgi:CYTH domain-containing protein